ncbi:MULTISPECIES: ice-binding family protein [unclassified Kitasatospora]|uniref:ice-binding family protein n=1 Tax=unclassified Kitasatospora TaxID=2633591 RepID=UPI000710A8BE|nr:MULTISPECIES: ice-binding family protein [unclassified Kitasatospora]KQV24105.1 hypothetical protein ASC99_02615 [Kitasatospora sp. Root107]KRB67180.1 hypothetical protein ASE03_02125 [Kitasatospora sp. Root187]
MTLNSSGAPHWRTVSTWLAAVVFVAAAAMTMSLRPAHAATAVPLGAAESFAVLGGQSVTNTGPTTITGDVGVSPGSSITGLLPIQVNGEIHRGDDVAANAQGSLVTAYNNAAGQPTEFTLASSELGGLTLIPGVYSADNAPLQLTGQLTLDAQGNPNAVWVFKTASTLITASDSSVLLINGAAPCNVYWQVGSSATLGTGTDFVGNILALTSIGLNTGATLEGRALARNGSVTLDNNVITRSTCAAGGTTGGVIAGATVGGVIAGTTGGTTTGGTATGGTTGGVIAGTTTGGATSGALGGLLGGVLTTGGATGGLLGGLIAGSTGGTTTGGTAGATTGGGNGGGEHGGGDHGGEHGDHGDHGGGDHGGEHGDHGDHGGGEHGDHGDGCEHGDGGEHGEHDATA